MARRSPEPVGPPPPNGVADLIDAQGNIIPEAVEHVYETAREWPAEQKASFLRWMKSAAQREHIKRLYNNPGELAHSIDSTFTLTPAVEMISESVERALREPRRNLMVTMPPQEGKSTLCAVWTPVRALQINPNTKIILATYGDDLASEHSLKARAIIEQYGSGVTDQLTGAEIEDKLGLSLKHGKARINSWGVNEGSGGLVAVGLHGTITGRPADLLIIDDPYKGPEEADSLAHRAKVSRWMKSVALTRLSPQASIILIQTRWHPSDLAGEILTAERELPLDERSWKHINVPAISEDGIKDSLGREPGVAMVSAREGRDAAEFKRKRRDVGERVWYALYMGAPSPPSGGLFDRAWFDGALDDEPENPVARIVAIDPADSGEGDETGILAGCLAADGTIVFTDDRSGHYTADQWSRRAVELALEVGAREIAMESYAAATTYVNVLKRALGAIRKEARKTQLAGGELTDIQRRALRSVPFVIHKWTGKGDAVARSALIRQALETKRAKVVEHKLAVFIDQAVQWQAGQHQPDRVAAGVILHDRLAKLGSGQMTVASPLTQRPLNAPEWLRRRIGG